MRRVLISVAFAGAAATVVALLLGSSSGCVQASADAPTVEELQADLKVEAALPAVVQIGQAVQVRASLVNVSETRTRTVVAPGDGSEAGWREPHVFLSMQRRGDDGTWSNHASRGIGRCGNYDSDWHDEIQDLPPDGKVDLSAWLPPLPSLFDFTQAGHFRFRLHYAYQGGVLQRGRNRDADPGRMGATPAFTIVSDWVPIEIRRGLEFAVTARRGAKVGEPISIHELIDARLVNGSADEVAFYRSEWGATLWTEPYGVLGDYRQPELHFIRAPDPTPLAPGASFAVFEGPYDGELKAMESGTVKVWVQLRQQHAEDPIVLIAGPVEVVVTK